MLDLAESGLEFDRRQLANMLFYETVTGSRVEDPQAWPAQRTAYARARLAWRGKPDETITEEALYDLTGKRLQEEEADRSESLRLERQGKIAALKGQGYEEARSHLSGVGGGRGAGFEPALKQGYLKVQMEYGPEELHAVRPLYAAFSEALRVRHARDFKGGPEMLDALAAFAKTDQAGRQRIITGIAVLAREDRIEITDFFQRVGNAFDDGILDIHLGLSANRMRRNRAALDQLLDEGVLPAGIQPGGVPELSGILAREGPGDWAGRYDQLANARMEVIPNVGPRYRPGDLQRAMTAEERRTLEEQRDQLDGLSKFFGDIGVSGIRIKHDADTLEHSGLLDTLGDTAVMMGGSLPEMGMAAAPGGVLLPAIFTSHFERHLAGLRADNPGLPEARLAPTAFASALTDTALSRAEILFVGGKLPGLRGALAKLGAAEGKIGVLTARAAATGEKLAASGLPGKALVAGAGFAGRSTATIGTELLQNVTPDVWKSVTHALHQDIRGADWDTVVARERAALGDTALLSMGLVVVFGTGRRALDFIGEGELRTLLTDRRGLLEQGLSPVDVERVVETAQYSPAEAADLVKQAADTTPVEERRERVRISWEEMMHEQQQVQTQLTQQRQMQAMEQGSQGQEVPVHSAADGRLLESGPAQGIKQVTATNGYRYLVDHLERPVRLNMDLVNKKEKRHRGLQQGAGGEDRLSSDEGGHLAASRHDGPRIALNHVAQDSNLNRGVWRVMENQWSNLVDEGKKVQVETDLYYEGESLRPSRFEVKVTVDGKSQESLEFFNRRGGK
ncbi:DNA/RNA non-specific endonuclease [Luteolibacter sp. Populi]|uniref:DNA/RNA non-specific endonuclease n=1 Tax=Luteolibacter sp. Populi TaxID=3230487 RepID=UPI00346513A5